MNNLQLAVNHVQEMRRLALAAGGAPMDDKRPQAWCEYGWPTDVTMDMLYRLYRRGGLAHGAVEKLIGRCWKTNPEVIQGKPDDKSTTLKPWEREVASVLTEKFWAAFKDADKRRLVQRYSALILRIKDNKSFDKPVTEKKSLAGVIVSWASAIKPLEYFTDTSSEEYGQVKMWQYTETRANGSKGNTVSIHPDRVIILGDWSADAIGFLEPAYNAFVNIEKVEGGSGEAFLKNAARQVAMSFDKSIDMNDVAAMYGVELKELQSKLNEAGVALNRGVDTVLGLQGATATTLTAAVPDPEPPYSVSLQTVCASIDMPSKILVGNQTGERASSEDNISWNSRCQSRREAEISPDIRNAVEHLQRIKVLSSVPEFSVVWDDLGESTAAEKLASAKTMSEINQVALASGEEVFDTNELRVAAGYEPRNVVQPLPEDGE